MTGYFDDPDKITYPEADRIVSEYLDEKAGQRSRTTSHTVSQWADLPGNLHNKKRLHDALSRLCEETGDKWAGRTVFRVPRDPQQ